jgi:hydroxyquinol 1,2-dioxygenase
MRDFDENNITAAVIDRYKNTPDPRLKKIMTSLVQHLHDFVRDVEPTEAEWGQAIDFLTRTGKLCTDKRQEFILLSDTLGVSMLVDAINHRFSKDATESTVMGPFYVQNPPEAAFGADIRGEAKGDPLYIDGSILSEDGQPVANAIIDVWHSDADGFYDVQLPELEGPTLRARFHSDARGRFRFWTIMPRYYPIPDDGTVGDMLKASARHPFRPAHVHFMIVAEGHPTLVTHVFVDGDQYLDSDAVFAVKNSLVRDFTREAPGVAPDGKKIDTPWRKLHTDFVLSGTTRSHALHSRSHAVTEPRP